MPPCNCHPPFPRPEPFSPLPRPGKNPDWGKWIRDRLAEKGALLAFPAASAFPDPGAAPSVYLAQDTGVLYRWDGSHYQVLADPSAANDVLEHEDRGHFPETGEHGKLYIAADTGSLYRWGGADYAELLGGKADKAVPQAAGNFAALAQDGNLADSGKKPSDYELGSGPSGKVSDPWTCVPPATPYNIPFSVKWTTDPVEGEGWALFAGGVKQGRVLGDEGSLELSWSPAAQTSGYSVSATRQLSGTEYHLGGQPGVKLQPAGDYASGRQGARADSAYQLPGTGVPKSDLSGGVQTSLGLADTAVQPGDILSGGKVKCDLLPSYVDDVIEVANYASLPGTGEGGKIYVTLDTNKTYRWGGTAYVEISNPDLTEYAKRAELFPAWGANKGYLADDLVIHDNAIYRSTSTQSPAAEWDPAKWAPATGAEVLAILRDYEKHSHKPQINGVELSGNKTAANLGLATKTDATLTPIYSQTPTFSAWTIYREGVDVTAQVVAQPEYQQISDEDFAWNVADVHILADNPDERHVEEPENATLLSWRAKDVASNDVVYTATRIRTDIVGYTLGSQTDKPVASEAEAEALRTAVAAKQNALTAQQLANIAAVSDALAFDATHSYATGDPVVYDGTLYTFTAAHTGAWTGSDVSAVDIIARLVGKQDVLTFDSKPLSGSVNPVTSEGILSALTSSTVVNRDMRNLKVAGLPASGTGYFVFRTNDNFDWAKAEWDFTRSIWMIGIAGTGVFGLRTTANPEVYEVVHVDLRGPVTHIQDLDFAIADTLSFIYNGLSYTVFGVTDDTLAKVSQLPTVPVQSVNGLTGAVVLTGAGIAVSGTDATKINAALAGKLGNSGAQTIENGSLTVKGDISLGGSGIRKFMFNSTCGMYYDVRGGWAKGITISNGQGTDVFIPLDDGEENVAALFKDVIAAVQQIAPAWVSGTAYAANALVSDYGIVYQNTSGGTIQSATPPDTSGSGWTAKKVSELFLLLTGGTMTGDFYTSRDGLHIKGSGQADFHLEWGSALDNLIIGATRETGGDYTLSFPNTGGTIALLASPAFTGTPTAPTPTAGDDSTKVATTAFVQGRIGQKLEVWLSVNPQTGVVSANYDDGL